MSKILVVEDNRVDFEFLKGVLEKEKHGVIHAENGQRGLELIGKEEPDIIILDVILPDIDGFEICKLIRQEDKFRNIPILFFTSKSAIEDKLLALGMGAADFLTKGIDERELLVRTRNLLRAKKVFDEMVKLSVVDGLTHVYNRRYFQHRLLDEFERARRYNREFCCLILDIDNFKKVNDTHGHPVGDTVLKIVVAVLRRNIRSADVLCRLGGDEFGLLLPETNQEGAFITAERVRKVIEKTEIGKPTLSVGITVSIGISSRNGGGAMGMDELVTQADVALYKAKRAGRNQTYVYGKDMDKGLVNKRERS